MITTYFLPKLILLWSGFVCDSALERELAERVAWLLLNDRLPDRRASAHAAKKQRGGQCIFFCCFFRAAAFLNIVKPADRRNRHE